MSLPSAEPEEPKSDKETCENKFILLQSQHIPPEHARPLTQFTCALVTDGLFCGHSPSNLHAIRSSVINACKYRVLAISALV